LPDEPTSLAAIVADPSQPGSVRDAAWTKLTPHVKRLSAAASGRTSCRDCREYVDDEAEAIVWQQLAHPNSQHARFKPKHGTFLAWAEVLLFRRLLDFHRSNCKGHKEFDPNDQTTKPPPFVWGQDLSWEREAEAVPDTFKEISDQLRSTLDQLAGVLAGAGRVNRHAVLLVQLRLAAAKLLKEARGAEVVETFVRWQPAEAQMAFKTGWPTLQTIWNEIRLAVGREPYWVSGSKLCEIVRTVSGGRAKLSEPLWLKWLERARAAAKAKVESEVWQKVFAPLLERS
jgi:hypothetical protein